MFLCFLEGSVFVFQAGFMAVVTFSGCCGFCDFCYLGFLVFLAFSFFVVFGCFWLLVLVCFCVFLPVCFKNVQTTSKTPIRKNKRLWCCFIRKERYNNMIYRSPLVISTDLICNQHGCAATYILHEDACCASYTQKFAPYFQPTALHARIGINILLSGEALRHCCQPSIPILLLLLFHLIQACTLVNTLTTLYIIQL